MDSQNLNDISPIDGRYAEVVAELNPICSEYGLIKKRLQVEIAWFKALAAAPEFKDLPEFSLTTQRYITDLIDNFTANTAAKIKAIESRTKHDVKSVEYFLQERFAQNPELKPYTGFIHFACTSADINNLAYALMLQEVRQEVLLPTMQRLVKILATLSKHYADNPMLARTHGQPATPTTVGKEFANFASRLARQSKQFSAIEILGKFNGAVGNFNAHFVAYPEIDWQNLCQKFVENFGITWNPYTTQIEPHDYIAEFCSVLIRFNNILLMLSRDIWTYIALGYFKQKVVQQEVGSSVMPHKVNPKDFENAEGNIGVANALLDFFVEKLPVSRMQRDLSDSTALRNLGVAFAHSLIAYKSVIVGLNKLEVNQTCINADLDAHWEVLAEPIQTIMRRYGIENAYEQLKELCRGKVVDREKLQQFVLQIDLPEKVKERILSLTPENYLGKAVELAANIDAVVELD